MKNMWQATRSTHSLLNVISYVWHFIPSVRVRSSWAKAFKKPPYRRQIERFDKSLCNKRHSFSINGQTVYVKTQSVAWKRLFCCVLVRESHATMQSIVRWTGRRDMTWHILENGVKTPINQLPTRVILVLSFSNLHIYPGRIHVGHV